ncbi:MAG: cation diffusion facilitator family transporter [Nitrososphaerota archaeon]|nr:cation diffusion facilitator family transporter [Nitrososphaerota archaeon]MDG6930950.1 cation diffusion facilitator family transporter [Nitrososphaerota archaeon]
MGSNFSTARTRTLVSLFAFLFLGLLKIIVGHVFLSPILIADGIHNMADVIMMLAAYLGLYLVSLHPSTNFPYGLYKGESLVSLFMGIAIVYAAFEMTVTGFVHLRPTDLLPLLVVEFISIAVSIYLGHWISGLMTSNSSVIKAERLHNYEDGILGIIVIAGIFMEWAGYIYLAYLCLVIIIVYLVFQSYGIMRDAVLSLLDASDKAVVLTISKVMNQISGIIGFHELKVRKAGPFYFVEMHLEMPHSLPVDRADAMTDYIEETLKEKVKGVVSVTIHVEPGSMSKKWILAFPVSEDGNISSHFGQAPGLLILNTHDGNYTRHDNPAADAERHKAQMIIDMLKKLGVNAVIAQGMDETAVLALSGAGIDVYITDIKTPQEAYEAFKEGKLKRYVA